MVNRTKEKTLPFGGGGGGKEGGNFHQLKMGTGGLKKDKAGNG